jgi:hypothetical protein
MNPAWFALAIASISLALSVSTWARGRVRVAVRLIQRAIAEPDGTSKDACFVQVHNLGRIVNVQGIAFEFVEPGAPTQFGWALGPDHLPQSKEELRAFLTSAGSDNRTVGEGATEAWSYFLHVDDRGWASKARRVRAKVQLTSGKTIVSNEQYIRAAYTDSAGWHWIAP